MGLDCTHGCWNGAYSAFSRWRAKLAVAAGYKMTAYNELPMTDLDWDSFARKNFQGEWGVLPADPLVVLLAHSDCDGYLPVEVLKPLADRLTELLPLLAGDGGGHIGSYRDKTQVFIDGLLLAHSLSEKVEFS